jgi:hypothetical protein
MTVHSWLTSSLMRHFPLDLAQPAQPPVLEVALNEQFSFQVAMRMEEGSPQSVRVEAEGPAGWSVRVRRVGLIPVRHHNTPIPATREDVDGLGHIPGYVPDPLFDENVLVLAPVETQSFWITVRPGASATPGWHAIRVIVSPEGGEKVVHTARVRLYDVEIGRRKGFAVTHWFYVDALVDWYRTDLSDERFWSILPAYVSDVAEHGQDTIYVPVFTPPLDGVKTPSQLLRVERVGPDSYRFDWSDVKRYIDLARACGIDQFEWCHLFTQWGARNAVRVYNGQGRGEELLWPPETGSTSGAYRVFLSQFLPELHRFLSDEKALDRSVFHVSDEPHGEQQLLDYGRARGLLRELAPWMKVMDALTDIEFARRGLTDMPIPSVRTALEFVQEGIPSWCYYCCGPRDQYINRLLDTPLPKIAMHGMLFYRWPFRGFLHWGYNYWYQSQTRILIDPYTVQDGLAWQRGWAYGDTFEVYPGPRGPVDSIRWEVFGESLQDYALLQTLGVARDDPRLEPIRSFADFPKAERWRLDTRARLLRQFAGGAT